MPAAPRLEAIAAIVGCWSGRPKARSTPAPVAAPIATARNNSAGGLDRQHDAHRHEHRDDDGPGSSPPGAREWSEDHERRGERCHPRRRQRAVEVETHRDVPPRSQPASVRVVVEPCDRDTDQQAGEEVHDDDVPEQAVALQDERYDEHADAHDRDEDLRDPLEHALRRRLEKPSNSTRSVSKPSTASLADLVTADARRPRRGRRSAAGERRKPSGCTRRYSSGEKRGSHAGGSTASIDVVAMSGAVLVVSGGQTQQSATRRRTETR